MAKIDVRLPNKNHLVIGTSGSGKSTWVKRQVKTARRLLIWDPDGEYPVNCYSKKTEFIRGLSKCYSTPQSAIGHRGAIVPVRLALAVEPTAKNFEWFCSVAFALADARRPLVVVAEEIADVTSPGKAGPWWGRLCRRGRKYGVTLYAITQRPAECDKTIYSQAAHKWIGFMDNEADQSRLAKLCGIAAARVGALKPLQYLYKQPGAAVKTGRVRIR